MADDGDDKVVPLRPRKGAAAARPSRPKVVVTAEEMVSAFERQYETMLRYLPKRTCWFEWKGGLWQEDLTALNKSLTLMASIGKERSNMKDRQKIDSYSMISAVEKLARQSPVFAMSINAFDSDPWMLNTPGGIVDLQKFATRPAEPKDYCTKITSVAPDFSATCPMWDAFLHEITNGDPKLVAYLMRFGGYCLTGSTQEQVMFFLYGTGQNGKGVFLRTLQKLMGSYATQASLDAFTASAYEKHSEALACLHGARLVVTSETEQGKSWDEAKIKSITGGDTIRARFMNRDSFEYIPTYKIAVSGNYKPNIKNVDEAIVRRQQIIPFTFKISDAEKVGDFEDYLCANEGGAILAAFIRGCVAWQESSLSPPHAVTNATALYIADEDTFAEWVNNSCVRTPEPPEHRQQSSSLYADWVEFASKNGEKPGSNKAFKARLESKFKLELRPLGNANWWIGIVSQKELERKAEAARRAADDPYRNL
jgi:putative DNA primase/helicase